MPTHVFAAGGSIDPSNRISWLCTSEIANEDCHDHTRVNWKLASSTAEQVVVGDGGLSGWIFSEQMGWIHLAPSPSSLVWGTVGGSHGVTNNINGTLGGYGWAIAGSWVNFAPTHGGVHINTTSGEFSGSAWVQNYGWMIFDCNHASDGTSVPCVKTDWHPPGSGLGDPVATPDSETATSTLSVSLSAVNSTNIHYIIITSATTTVPTCSTGSIFDSLSSPITVATSLSIKAIACNGAGSSNVKTFDYIINIPIPIIVGDPVASPVAGTYTATTTITLSSASSTSILYTNDGNDPVCPVGASPGTGTTYSVPIDILSTVTIKAIGCNDIYFSNVVSFAYTINLPTPPPPISPPDSSLPSGTYTGTQTITLSSLNSTSIHYTTDGIDPGCSFIYSTYDTGITITNSETIKAIGCGAGGLFSSISVFNYTINPVVVVITGLEATSTATSTGIIINPDIPFIVIATTTSETVNTVINATNEVIANTSKSIKKNAVAVQQVFNSPENTATIQAVTTSGVVVGTAVPIASGLFFSSFSLADILLIPIRLWSLLMGFLGLAKRKKPWGTVYDAVTKQPLDPAYVVLKSVEGVDVATAITDLDGRYGFVVPEPGNYSLFVHKTNYMFPSQKLVGQDHDELYRDLYFGEHFPITKAGEFVAKNIPMDPEKFDWNEFAKKSQRLMNFYSTREKWFSRISNFFFWAGFVISSFAVLFSMSRLNIIIFSLYGVMYLFRIFGLHSRPFGKIVSKYTGKPIPYTIIRVTQANTGVEIMHRVSDSIGRYYCLLPNNDYLIRIDQKLADGTYKKITEGIPVKVTKGYLSEKFAIDNIPIDGVYTSKVSV